MRVTHLSHVGTVTLSLMIVYLLLATVTSWSATPPSLEIILDSWAPYYQPHTAVVSSGTPIQWINPTASPHTIRHDGCFAQDPCLFDSGIVAPEASFTLLGLPPGRYSYRCELHPIMQGTLIIIDPAVQSSRLSQEEMSAQKGPIYGVVDPASSR